MCETNYEKGRPAQALSSVQLRVQRLFLQHTVELESFIRSMVPLAHEADDIYQQTFLAIMDKAEIYNPEMPFRPWAISTARLMIRQWMRDRSRQSERFISAEALDLLTDQAVVDDSVEVDSKLLEQCIKRLSDSARRLLKHHYLYEQSGAEIAEALGVKIQSVYNGLTRTRSFLRECVRQERERDQQVRFHES